MIIMDFESNAIDFFCECGFQNSATLQEVVNGGSLICVGCLSTIVLQDGDGETKRAIDETKQALRDLGRILNGH